MRIAPGVIVRLHDNATYPEKLKRHVCVCVERRIFLRINSDQPRLGAFFLVRPERCGGGIDHESYVELDNPHRPSAKVMRDAVCLGRMQPSACLDLALAVRTAATLTQEVQELVWDRLSDL